jgi:hypothetical protein
MPFDLYVSRAAMFDAAEGAAPSGGWRRALSSIFAKPKPPGPSTPITVDELHALMRDAPATRHGEALYRVRHPQGDPWFTAEWAEGHIVLSTSYTHHRFLRNLGDMFDQALALAAALDARLFEEATCREVTRWNVDDLLAVNGSYLSLQAKTWRHTMEMLDNDVRAPLEYPIGPVDGVAEFLICHVEPQRQVSLEAIRDAIEQHVAGTKAETPIPNALQVLSAEGRALAKVLLRPDGQWQVWPSHGEAAFSAVAPAVIGAAECIRTLSEGKTHFCGRELDAPLLAEVQSRAEGLSVDFYTWTQSLATP